jgi:hypothetical protein
MHVQRIVARKATARSPLLQNPAVMPRLLDDRYDSLIATFRVGGLLQN